MEKITRFKDIPVMIQHGNYNVHYPLDSVMPWIEEQKLEMGLDLDPDFQRGHVWTSRQQIAFMEFFLRGGKTGRVLYFNCPGWHHGVGVGQYKDFVIVDGKQRLRAIERFINNEIKVFGSLYREFTDKPNMVRDCVQINVNDLTNKADVLRWYIQMNEGGVKHTTLEIRRVKQLLATEFQL